jgi:hypothetical protein
MRQPPDTSLAFSGASGFLFLGLFVSTLAGICNFTSMNAMARRTELFKHGPFRQFIIDVIALVVAPILALTAFRQDDDLYTWHSFHILVWVLLFGVPPRRHHGAGAALRSRKPPRHRRGLGYGADSSRSPLSRRRLCRRVAA